MPEQEDSSTPETRGPHGWLNWYAERLGEPRREDVHPESVVVQPLWEEHALYTDAAIDGPWLQLGPYEFILLDPGAPSQMGAAGRALVLRTWDHLSDEPQYGSAPLRQDVQHYFGGDIGDELAALLGLSLARRVRSGGSVRLGLPNSEPIGFPTETNHRQPLLEAPRRAPMIPWVADPVTLSSAESLLSRYPALAAAEAVALVRAARQYVDGLWVADGDPRLAWIKLIGALEAAANRVDDTRAGNSLQQLKRHRPRLHRALQAAPAEVAAAVAAETSRHFQRRA